MGCSSSKDDDTDDITGNRLAELNRAATRRKYTSSAAEASPYLRKHADDDASDNAIMIDAIRQQAAEEMDEYARDFAAMQRASQSAAASNAAEHAAVQAAAAEELPAGRKAMIYWWRAHATAEDEAEARELYEQIAEDAASSRRDDAAVALAVVDAASAETARAAAEEVAVREAIYADEAWQADQAIRDDILSAAEAEMDARREEEDALQVAAGEALVHYAAEEDAMRSAVAAVVGEEDDDEVVEEATAATEAADVELEVGDGEEPPISPTSSHSDAVGEEEAVVYEPPVDEAAEIAAWVREAAAEEEAHARAEEAAAQAAMAEAGRRRRGADWRWRRRWDDGRIRADT